MKLKLALASLLLAATAPFSVSAQTTDAIPGEIGVLTFTLRVASQTGGFANGDYNFQEPLLNKTSYRSVIVYNRVDPVASLVTRYGLPGLATDYTVRYVKADTFTGYFLVNKTETTIICIGSDNFDNSFGDAISTFSPSRSEITNESSVTIRKENGDYTDRGAVTSSISNVVVYLNFSAYSPEVKTKEAPSVFTAIGFLSRAGTYTATYTSKNDSYVETNRTGAIKYTDLVGSNSFLFGGDDYYDYSQFISGSINISALRPVTNVRPYLQAFQDRYDNNNDS